MLSPVPDGTPALISTKRKYPPNYRITLQVKLGHRKGACALAFGVKGGSRYTIALTHQRKGNPIAALGRYVQGGDLEQLTSINLWEDSYIMGGWLPIELEVRGEVIKIKAGQADPITYKAQGQDLTGHIGLELVVGLLGKTPVRFRDLHLEVLK